MTLLLADGHNLLFRSFYGVPARVMGRGGIPLNAVLGVIGMLLRVAKAEAVSSVLVAFDSETGSFRDRQMESYKANRVRDFSTFPPEQNPFTQLAPLKAALDVLGWRHCELGGIEADDVIAAYARAACGYTRTVVVSADSDMLQLVSSTVTVIAGRNRQYGTSDVVKKFGVLPAQLPLLKAMAGDRSDNISGVRGIGQKTATLLIQKYETIDRLFEDLESLPRRYSRLLEGARNDLEETLKLVTLDRDVVLPFTFNDLNVKSASSIKTMDVLRSAQLL